MIPTDEKTEYVTKNVTRRLAQLDQMDIKDIMEKSENKNSNRFVRRLFANLFYIPFYRFIRDAV